MSDDMDDLKAMLKASPPGEPDAGARQRALEAAMVAFDDAADNADAAAAKTVAGEKNSAVYQGTGEQLRQRDRQSGLMTLVRSTLMNLTLPSTKTLMLGGASLAVIMLAVVSTQEQARLGMKDLMAPNEPARVTDEKPEPAPLMVEQDRFTDEEVSASTESADINARSDAPAQLELGEVRGGADNTAALPRAEPERAIAPLAPAKPVATGANNRASIRERQQGRAGALPLLSNQPAARGKVAAQEQPADLRAQPTPTTGAILPMDRNEADADVAPAPGYDDQGRDAFEEIVPNPVKVTKEEPVSTFSVDVDTASYTFMRQALNRRVLPQKNAVRIEELVNYFPYDYDQPDSRETPFTADVAVMATPWNQDTKLMRIGIQGYELAEAEKPKSNLVFLLDTSGSMNSPDKLPLLIDSFSLLVDTLDADDTVSIVVYAGSAGTVLEPTKASEKGKILRALERLSAGGSTAGGEGIRQAYKLAEQNFDQDGINRVILATDGDFNVGIRNTEELQSFIERKRETGVFLSVLGFGRGNYNDALMQTLAQNGNGTAAYIDTINEAQKVLVDEASSTLFPIAKDVKIQVEFNPAVVGEYRLIGFETRMLNREDFNNDKVDAGDIGAGHSVTALYEITPTESEARQIDELRYQTTQQGKPEQGTDTASEYAFVKIRYKQPDADESQLITQPVTAANEIQANTEANFAAAVAAFGQLLRGGRHTGDFTYDDIIKLAASGRGEDTYNYRGEFISLVRKAKAAAALERQR